MYDYISRQAAIDTLNVDAELLRRVLDETDIVGTERAKYEWGLGLIESYISDIKELPSAQPERKKGKWIDYSDEGYVECPFCHSATNCDGNKDELHFCFSCGADLRGEQDDSISD